jgi:hypothetical protein
MVADTMVTSSAVVLPAFGSIRVGDSLLSITKF